MKNKSYLYLYNTLNEYLKIFILIITNKRNFNFLNLLRKEIDNNIFLAAQARVAMYYISKFLIQNEYREFYLSPFTNIEIIEALKFANAKIHFIDIDVKTGYPKNLDKIIEKKNQKRCLIITHLYSGHDDLKNLYEKLRLRDENLKVIEDNALNFGMKFNNQYLGLLFDFGIFSFGKLKKFSIIYGGAIYFKDKAFEDYYSKIEKEKLKDMPKSFILKELIKALIFKISLTDLIYNFFTIHLIKYAFKFNIKFLKKSINPAKYPKINYSIPKNYFFKFPFFLSNFAVEKYYQYNLDRDIIISKVNYYAENLKDIDDLILPKIDKANNLINIYTEYPIILRNESKLGLWKYFENKNFYLRKHWYQNVERFYSFKNLEKLIDSNKIQDNCICLPCNSNIDRITQDVIINTIFEYFNNLKK